MPRHLLRFLNVAAFLIVIVANGFAASGAMSGQSIGVIANRIPSLFLPANWVFGIWSLIYLGLAACMVYQALPTPGAARAIGNLGPWWMASSALNIAWISLFSFEQFAAALLVMVALLAVLLIITERLRIDGAVRASIGELLCVRWPFDLYLAWISVALISNSFQYAHVIGFGGFGIAEPMWSVAMMAIAALLGAWMAWGRGMWIFPLVVAWAVYGIGARYVDHPVLGSAANPIAVGAVLVGLAGWWVGRSAHRAAPQSQLE